MLTSADPVLLAGVPLDRAHAPDGTVHIDSPGHALAAGLPRPPARLERRPGHRPGMPSTMTGSLCSASRFSVRSIRWPDRRAFVSR